MNRHASTGAMNVSEATRRLNPVIFGGQPVTPDQSKLLREAIATPRLRQNRKGPNKTEREFTTYLRGYWIGATIYEQAVTLVLANGLRYTADNFVPDVPLSCLKGGPTEPRFYEVKGHMRDDAAAKLKMAARVHSWASFYLVTKQRKRDGAGWRIERVLP